MVAKRKLAKKVDSLTHEWNITLYSDDLKDTISEELKKIQARVHLDGFRNGHAPIDVVLGALLGEHSRNIQVNIFNSFKKEYLDEMKNIRFYEYTKRKS